MDRIQKGDRAQFTRGNLRRPPHGNYTISGEVIEVIPNKYGNFNGIKILIDETYGEGKGKTVIASERYCSKWTPLISERESKETEDKEAIT